MVPRPLTLLLLLLPAAVGLALGAALTLLLRAPAPPTQADPERIADAALLSMREQGRLTLFTARFAAIVTASETRFGLRAQKTLIMPGTVRYGVDLGRLRRENIAWDERSRTLTVTVPPLEISTPQIDLNDVREHAEGGLAMALTDAEERLDQVNRREGQLEMLRQARAAQPMTLARSAALRTVARGFAIPLRAAGIDASVATRFVDASGEEQASWLDRPRRIEDSVDDRRAGR
jgi:hypothetical protein